SGHRRRRTLPASSPRAWSLRYWWWESTGDWSGWLRSGVHFTQAEPDRKGRRQQKREPELPFPCKTAVVARTWLPTPASGIRPCSARRQLQQAAAGTVFQGPDIAIGALLEGADAFAHHEALYLAGVFAVDRHANDGHRGEAADQRAARPA